MITRDSIKREIDQLQDQHLGFLHRIIRALIPSSSIGTTPLQVPERDESWQEFLQNTYGMFRDTPLERSQQGTLEVREEIE